MKRFFAIFVAILAISAISSTAFAQAPTLPDYQKDGKLTATYLCDSGKTTVRDYVSPKWTVYEIRTESGRLLMIVTTQDGWSLFIQDAESATAKEFPLDSFDKIFVNEAPMARASLMEEQHDCKKQ